MKKHIIVLILLILLTTLTSCDSKVDEKTWSLAFSKETFQNCKIVGTYGANGIEDSERYTLKFDDNIVYSLEEEVYYDGGSFELDEEEYLYTDSDNVTWWYWYDTDERQWYKEIEENPSYSFLDDILNNIAHLYELFEYDEENEYYKKVSEDQIIIVYFEKDKVSKIKRTYYTEDYSETVIIEFSDYGKINLSLPSAKLYK